MCANFSEATGYDREKFVLRTRFCHLTPILTPISGLELNEQIAQKELTRMERCGIPRAYEDEIGEAFVRDGET